MNLIKKYSSHFTFYLKEYGWLYVIKRIREKIGIEFEKLYTLFIVTITAPFSIPMVLVIRFLKSIVIIRFIEIESFHIGNLIHDIDFYLSRKDIEKDKHRTLDLFYFSKNPINKQIAKMWKRLLFVNYFVKILSIVNRIIPGGENHEHVVNNTNFALYKYIGTTKPHLIFTTKEELKGIKWLRQMGINEGDEFICFQSRDTIYARFKNKFGDLYFQQCRNSNIRNYIAAAEAMTNRGYYAIRVGYLVEDALTTNNPMIIDYSTKYRTDFLDIYLCAKCRFAICTNTALAYAVPMVFRKPFVFVNFISFNWLMILNLQYKNFTLLFIPKKLWLKSERRFLTFYEIYHSKVKYFELQEEFDKYDITVMENTPEEIASVVIEMDDRLKGQWTTTNEDEALQRQFWSITNIVFPVGLRIGAKFLRDNKNLLE